MADVADQWRSEMDEGADAGLKAFATIDDVLPKEVANGNDKGLDLNGADSNVSDILEFDKIGANVDGTTSESDSSASTHVEPGESSNNVGEVVEEEIVELEFEKVKPKLATHSMHCPSCKSELTKVTLRRKVLLYRPTTNQPADLVTREPQPAAVQAVNQVAREPEPEPEPEHKQEDLVGCLSCLSLFTSSDNGCFNPFDIFKKTPETTISPASAPSGTEMENNESCFSMFWVIKKGKNNQQPEDVQPSETLDVNPRPLITTGYIPGPSTDAMINIADEPETLVVPQPTGRTWLGYDGVLADILKSIVYGGLMEVIASLSIVASAAASDASTLSIIALALASLVGGVIVIGHQIWDLRDDCYMENANNETFSKYKEQLGQVNYFPLHVFVAILSFLVFGIVPPVAYGYSIHETNDKDYTIAAVAITSLACVALLAICKAYINKCTVLEYFKTVVYYITFAVSVSGVSYVAGNLLARLMEEYGLFASSSGGGSDMSFLSRATTSSLASY